MQDLADQQLQDLMAQKAEIERKVNLRRSEVVKSVIRKIQEAITSYQITPSDIFGTERRMAVSHVKSPIKPKYRDPETGATWTGRGKPPKWIADKDRTRFLIEEN